MLNIVICDDQAKHSDIVEQYAGKFFSSNKIEVSYFCYDNGDSLINDKNISDFDIFILDINLSNENGIDLANKICKLVKNPQIIFVTSFHEYFIRVYEAPHIYLVTKTEISTLLPKALERALENKAKTQHLESVAITIKYKGETHVLELNDLIYVENALRKLKFHTADCDYYTYANFDTYDEIKESSNFIQCHRSYIVNTKQIAKIVANEIFLKDDSIIPIGRNFKMNLIRSFYSE